MRQVLRAIGRWLCEVVERIGVECSYREFPTFEEAVRYNRALIKAARKGGK